MPRIVVSPLAQADIDDIWDHIARDSRVNAECFVDRIEQRFGLLAANPAWALPATIFGQACAGFAMRAT